MPCQEQIALEPSRLMNSLLQVKQERHLRCSGRYVVCAPAAKKCSGAMCMWAELTELSRRPQFQQYCTELSATAMTSGNLHRAAVPELSAEIVPCSQVDAGYQARSRQSTKGLMHLAVAPCS